MARQSLQKVYADFRQGWVDVASPLQQPEGTVKDIVNFDINIDGTLSKRSGLRKTGADYFRPVTGQDIEKGFDTILWENVDKDVNRTFLVVRKDRQIDVFDVSHGNIDMSPNYLIYSTTLPNIYGTVKSRPMAGASALGRFFFAVNSYGAGYFEYNPSNNSVSLKRINLQVRDLTLWKGPNDTFTGLERSSGSVCEPWRYYNLRNSGWPNTVRNVTRNQFTFEVNEDVYADPIKTYKDRLGTWPKLSENFYISRSGGGQNAGDQLAFNPYNYAIDVGGTGWPSVGKYIVDVDGFERSATGSYIDNNIETYILSEGMSKIAFYAGRLWYYSEGDYSSIVSSGKPKSPVSNEGVVYFSQTLERDITNASKCYQENDPTAEDVNQLLATDGGSLAIKEVGAVKALIPLGTSLFVVSDQGVWRITGTDFNTFTADAYTVDKITDKGVLSEKGVAVSRDTIYMFSEDGIYAIRSQGQVGEVGYEDISTPLIKNFFYDLPKKAAENVVVRFDRDKNLLFCLLAMPANLEEEVPESFYKRNLNMAIIFNSDLGAYYKYHISLPEGYGVLDAVYGLGSEKINLEELVVDSNGEEYVNSSGENFILPGIAFFKTQDSVLQLIISDNI